jgi:hypothetical protein
VDVGGLAIVDSLVVVQDGHPDPGPNEVVACLHDFAVRKLILKLGNDLVA